MKGDQEVGGFNKNQDGWIMLFTRDPVASDTFKWVPVTGSGDKEEKTPQVNRLVVLHENTHWSKTSTYNNYYWKT